MRTKVFRVREPFRLYRQVGTYPANSHMRTHEDFRFGQNEAFNARPGDEIHVTPEGTFLSRPDGPTWRVNLVVPKSNAMFMRRWPDAAMLGADPRAIEVFAPSTVCDVEEADAIASVLHVPGMEVHEFEESPELARFKEKVGPLVEALADLPSEVGSTWLFRDHMEYPVVALLAYNTPKMGGHDGFAPEFSIHYNFQNRKAIYRSPGFDHVEMDLSKAIEAASQEIERIAQWHKASPAP